VYFAAAGAGAATGFGAADVVLGEDEYNSNKDSCVAGADFAALASTLTGLGPDEREMVSGIGADKSFASKSDKSIDMALLLADGRVKPNA
jgi:hypothetical protein